MRQPSDEQVDAVIGQVLRGGVLLSSAVTFVGLVLYLLHHATATPNYHTFHSINGQLRHMRELFPDAIHGNPLAIIQVGILLLIATPVARVAFLVGAFALERDRLYIGVSGLVLVVLLYSILLVK
jgi:uncharacterized membrane protein